MQKEIFGRKEIGQQKKTNGKKPNLQQGKRRF